MGDHPWRRFRREKDWLLEWALLPDGVMGVTDWDARTVVLDQRLTQAERRSTIAHELEHIRRGPFPAWMTTREEEAVEQAAARKLIPLDRLIDALAWSRCRFEVAEELWVDVDTLEARLRGLHPSEWAVLTRRLGDS